MVFLNKNYKYYKILKKLECILEKFINIILIKVVKTFLLKFEIKNRFLPIINNKTSSNKIIFKNFLKSFKNEIEYLN